MSVYIYIHIHLYTYRYTYMYVYIHVNIYIYEYIYIFIHTYKYVYIMTYTCHNIRRENGRNVTSFRAWPLWPATWVGYELGGSAPHQCRWAGYCLFAALSWLCVGCSGFGRFVIDLSFLREQSTWSFSGLDSCVLTYCNSAAPLFSLQFFYNYARGHRESAQASNCSGEC